MNKQIKKKKKGFTLIELIIVLAIMAIIAAIAIPNITATKDHSKTKTDEQSCESVKRNIMALIADGSIAEGNKSGIIKGVASGDATCTGLTDTKETGAIQETLKNLNNPTGKTKWTMAITDGAVTWSDKNDSVEATQYGFSIDTNGKVEVHAIPDTTK